MERPIASPYVQFAANTGYPPDAGALALTGESVTAAVAQARPWLNSVHASEPQLAPVGVADELHEHLAAALRARGYGGIVSVEMKPVAGDDQLAAVVRAATFAQRVYGG